MIHAFATLAISAEPASTGVPLTDWTIQLHVALSLLSAAFLTLAAVQALALALQDRLLHHGTRNRFVQALPPLQTMEQWLFLLIAVGFFLLSLSLLSGLMFVGNLMAPRLAQITVLSVTAWGIFGALLWGRWRRGWRGRTAIRWTLLGYGVLVVVLSASLYWSKS